MSVVQLALRIMTFGFFGKREVRTIPRDIPDDLIDTQEREDTRARYLAACDKLEEQAEASMIVSRAAIESHPA